MAAAPALRLLAEPLPDGHAVDATLARSRGLLDAVVLDGVEVVAEAETITEQAAQDVPAIEVGEVPADAPCSHPSCAHADPASPCVCTFCVGAGHGWITARIQDAARARCADRIAKAGGVFATLAIAGGLAEDDEEW